MTARTRGPSGTVPPPVPPGNDPGHAAARLRAEGVSTRSTRCDVVGSTVLVGTASWTDPTITAGEVFYPAGANTPEARLRYYASQFPVVEVDSSYYAVPSARSAALWVERTPDDFVFHVKAHALMTGQPTEIDRLPPAIVRALPAEILSRHRAYAKDLPAEIVDEIWLLFAEALMPLRDSGKLAAVLMQYPRWFTPTTGNVDLLLDGQRRMRALFGDGVAGPVELRNRRWFGEERRKTERTVEFFREHCVPLVIVDGPQGLESSVPMVAAVTTPGMVVARLHGRNARNWEARGLPTVERYRYLYDHDELRALVAELSAAAAESPAVHVLFNNCHGNYGTTNALEFGAMLSEL